MRHGLGVLLGPFSHEIIHLTSCSKILESNSSTLGPYMTSHGFFPHQCIHQNYHILYPGWKLFLLDGWANNLNAQSSIRAYGTAIIPYLLMRENLLRGEHTLSMPKGSKDEQDSFIIHINTMNFKHSTDWIKYKKKAARALVKDSKISLKLKMRKVSQNPLIS